MCGLRARTLATVVRAEHVTGSLARPQAAYMYLSLALIQMLKAGTPVVVMLTLVVLRVEHISARVASAVTMMAFGTALTASGELSGSVLGLVIMICSEFAEAIRLAVTQRALSNFKFSLLEGMYYLQSSSALCLFVLAAFTEIPTVGPKRLYALSPLLDITHSACTAR
jgi:hypothetical protein